MSLPVKELWENIGGMNDHEAADVKLLMGENDHSELDCELSRHEVEKIFRNTLRISNW